MKTFFELLIQKIHEISRHSRTDEWMVKETVKQKEKKQKKKAKKKNVKLAKVGRRCYTQSFREYLTKIEKTTKKP